ncbi:hypothetical protein [Thermococcus sp. MAR1]|uniref:hypothetical protein n=1 Tax=Thermococcus sp. MAR1 TaxID=1638263 RepID=UPI0014399C14|nr:hypothetical protein [Thermococcus sp. MAR1]NJE10023.1 hypothetical protein [Thermococcus sp. MAR1]
MDPISKAIEEAKNNPKLRKKLRIKAALTTVLMIAFLGVIFITVGTFISARQGTFLGMNQLDFLRLRARYGLLMMFLIILHIATNWRIYRKELELLSG